MGEECCNGVLPTATLDDVAKQIRQDFKDKTSGKHAEEAPQPPVQAAKAAKKRVSQEMFDDVVNENVEEFGMELDEAMQDAIEQFKQQGADLSLVATSVQEKKENEEIKAEVDRLNALLRVLLKDELVTGQDGAAQEEVPETPEGVDVLQELCKVLDSLTARCASGSYQRACAGKHGAVGAAAFVCKKLGSEKAAVLSALSLLEQLFREFTNREGVPAQGIAAIVEVLVKYDACPQVQRAGFGAASQAILKHEANKRHFKDMEMNSPLLASLRAHQANADVLLVACRFLRVYLSDDDRRPGVQPGTFIRARELGENYDQGALKPLFEILSAEFTLANDKMVSSTFTALKAVAVNDTICKHVASKGGLETALVAFEAHITDESISAQGCALLKAVSRNDAIKRTVGKGTGLGLLLRSLEQHPDSPRVAEQALQGLSVLCLRQPENCQRFAELGCLQLIIQAMQRHPSVPMAQRAAIATLRNMVSSWQNKELASQILDHGAEALIRQARAAHPVECEEVSFAALRDLGCSYHN